MEQHKLRIQFETEQVSIGALLVPPFVKTDPHKALQYVDKLLYKAKAEGRNRVIFEKMG